MTEPRDKKQKEQRPFKSFYAHSRDIERDKARMYEKIKLLQSSIDGVPPDDLRYIKLH